MRRHAPVTGTAWRALAVALVLLPVLAAPPRVAGGPLLEAGSVSFSLFPASPANLNVNETVNMAIRVNSGTQVVDGIEAVLRFDAAVLEVVDQGAGDGIQVTVGDCDPAFLPESVWNTADNTGGTVHVARGVGVDGDGLPKPPKALDCTLATVQFRAKAAGTSTITFVRAPAPRPTIATLQGETLPVLTSDGTVTVVGAGPVKLAFVIQPGGATAGVPWNPQPKVEVQDNLGNTVAGDPQVQVALSFKAGTAPEGALLTCTSNLKTTVAGQATFAGCQVNKAANGYRLTATAANLTAAESDPFDIVPGPATRLAFSTQPSNWTAGTPWNVGAQPAAVVQDSLGNTVTGDSTTQVTLTITDATGTPGATLTCTPAAPNKVTAVQGVATFQGCQIDKAGNGYTLTATAPGLPLKVSDPFSITPAGAVGLKFVTSPGNGVAGTPWDQDQRPKVVVQDSLGNTVDTDTTTSITLSITQANGATLTCTTNPKTVTAGEATFDGCKINKAGKEYTLTATATAANLALAVSGSFDITPGQASRLAFTTQPGGGNPGSVWPDSAQPVVAVQDSLGNTVTSDGSTQVSLEITLNSGTSGAVLACTTKLLTVVSGVASFSLCTINLAGAGYTLTATAPSLTQAVSDPFSVGVALRLVPSATTVTVGQAVDVEIRVEAGTQSVSGVEAVVSFDADKAGRLSVVDADDATEGVQQIVTDGLNPPCNLPTLLLSSVEFGRIRLSRSVDLAAPQPISGTCALGRVRFSATALGGAVLSFAVAPANPATSVLASSGTSLALAPTDATIAVAAPPGSRTLTVTKNGTGSGKVTSSPTGVSCGTVCMGAFAEGTGVTLTAAPVAGSVFTGWSGACTGTGTCVVTLSADRAVAATFDTVTGNNFTLIFTTAGTGSGSTGSNPAGNGCGSGCYLYVSGTAVALTAMPEAGSAFAGWSGDADCSDGTVVMNGNRTCIATFSAPYTLSVAVASGSGTVMSTPTGINCGTDCSEIYASGTSVTLTAAPAAGYSFSGWSGDCTGSNVQSTVILSADRSCSAAFAVTGGGNSGGNNNTGGGGSGSGGGGGSSTTTTALSPTGTITATSGGQVASSGVTVSFLPGTVDAQTNIVATVEPMDLGITIQTALQATTLVTVPEGFMLGTVGFQLRAQDGAGNPVTRFAKPASLTVKVTEEDLRRAGRNINLVTVQRYDLASRKWIDLATQVTGTATVRAETLEPGIFGLLVELPVPVLAGPAQDAVVTDMAPDLKWSVPAETVWYHLQVLPYNLDGPAIDLVIGDPEMVASGSYRVAPPKLGVGNYVLLPGMSYLWRVRTSPSKAPAGVNDPVWSRWGIGGFRTAAPSLSGLNATAPAGGTAVATLTPTLTWTNTDDRTFYYELQLSKDATFSTDPTLAKAAVYWELVHGGMTVPLNSYSVRPQFPLEPKSTYFWRVRPRVQGDGKPTDWSTVSSFKTP